MCKKTQELIKLQGHTLFIENTNENKGKRCKTSLHLIQLKDKYLITCFKENELSVLLCNNA